MVIKSVLPFILAYSLSAQEIHTTLVDIYIGDCRSDRPYETFFNDTIRLYQEDHLVEQIIPKAYKSWPITTKGLRPGAYRVSFPNMFGQKVAKNIVIPDSANYSIHLPIDELTDYPRNSITLLKENESITLFVKETSCMGGFQERVKITKRKAAYIASLHSEKGIMSIQLNKSQLGAFKRFENELEHIKSDGLCTTRDYYSLKLKSGTIEKRDGYCSWYGYYFLKRSFFGREE